jgi:hypothetical protein
MAINFLNSLLTLTCRNEIRACFINNFEVQALPTNAIKIRASREQGTKIANIEARSLAAVMRSISVLQ